MKIIYRDNDIIVCIKPSGVISTDEPGGMPGRIRTQLGTDGEVRTVHRLDTVVAGLMVYALTQEAASRLSAQITDKTFQKEYLAVVEGHPAESSGRLDDLLLRNPSERKTYVTAHMERGAREASLEYTTVGKTDRLHLVRIRLITGRTHQIRAQFSSRSLPLFGDKKYGSVHPEQTIALWSCRLAFTHPVTGEPLCFEALPPAWEPWTQFAGFSAQYDSADVLCRDRRPEILTDCPHAERCGGCAYPGLAYEKQLEKKQKCAEKWLRPFGSVSPIVPAPMPLFYRARVFRSFGLDRRGAPLCGIYREGQLIPIGQCRLSKAPAEEIIAAIRALGLPPYDERKGTGWLRQVQVRIAADSGQIMVVLSAASRSFKSKSAFLSQLLARFPRITTVLLEAERQTQVLYGPGTLEESLCGLRLCVNPRSFTRGNPPQEEALCRAAIELAALQGGERVVDVCCGGGTLGLLAAQRGARVLGIDRSPEAIREAIANAKQNSIRNIRFIHADAAEYLMTLSRSREKIDVLFLDPPRAGCPKGLLSAVEKLRPGRIVYLCDNPELLAAELTALPRYRAAEIRPVDVAPFTRQIDIAALLRIK